MKGIRSFINAINSPWAIEPKYGQHMAAIAFLIESGKMELTADTFDISASEPYDFEFNSTKYPDTHGKVAVLPIDGPLMRDDQFCGPMGSVSLAETFRKADRDSEIDAHVIKMCTPGGQVLGLEDLSIAIADAEKPVVVYGEWILSAGMHIAAGADFIVLSGRNAEIGSIGVQLSYRSFKEMFEKMGVQDISIKATTSPDKNKFNYDNPTEEDKNQIAVETLDPLDAHFMDHVRKYRVNVKEEALTGNVYFAEQAIELGLADEIGDFEYAVNLALSIAGKSNNSMSTEPKTKAADDAPAISDLQAAQQLASARADLITARDATIATQSDTITALQTTVEQQTQQIADLNTKVEQLSALPAADTDDLTVAPKTDAADAVDQPKVENLIPPTSGIFAAMNRYDERQKRQNKPQ